LKIAIDSLHNHFAIIKKGDLTLSKLQLNPGSDNHLTLIYAFKSGSLYHVEIKGSNEIQINEQNISAVPDDFKLVSFYPNPSGGNSTLKFVLNNNGWVSYEIYNIKGERVLTSSMNVNFQLTRELSINLTKYPSGVYFCKIFTASSAKILKLLLMK